MAGLEVQSKDGVWHGVLPQPGTLVINVGDMAQVPSSAFPLSAETVMQNDDPPVASAILKINVQR